MFKIYQHCWFSDVVEHPCMIMILNIRLPTLFVLLMGFLKCTNGYKCALYNLFCITVSDVFCIFFAKLNMVLNEHGVSGFKDITDICTVLIVFKNFKTDYFISLILEYQRTKNFLEIHYKSTFNTLLFSSSKTLSNNAMQTPFWQV